MSAKGEWIQISVEDMKRIVSESKDDKDFRKKLKELENSTKAKT